MIAEYEVVFVKHGGHGKEAELRIYKDIVTDFKPSIIQAIEEARFTLEDFVLHPDRWQVTSAIRIK